MDLYCCLVYSIWVWPVSHSHFDGNRKDAFTKSTMLHHNGVQLNIRLHILPSLWTTQKLSVSSSSSYEARVAAREVWQKGVCLGLWEFTWASLFASVLSDQHKKDSYSKCGLIRSRKPKAQTFRVKTVSPHHESNLDQSKSWVSVWEIWLHGGGRRW